MMDRKRPDRPAAQEGGQNRREILFSIAARVREAGGRAMLVGGCVRDELLGLACGDVDCEIYGLLPQALCALAAQFGEVEQSGARYGVYSLRGQGIDLAIPRLERRTGPLHRDFDVILDPYLPPERAAARRDFTVNAILRDVLTGEYVDPFGGREDLENRVLRALPGEGFEEDPLRVLRGAQFASRFGLTPDAQTRDRMARMPLFRLSPARVMEETKKALLQAGEPDVYFRVLGQVGALGPWFAELKALEGVPQNPRYHPEGDAFEHTMLVLREAAGVRTQARDPWAFMLAALVHDLGKAVSTRKNAHGEWHSAGHEQSGMPLARALLSRIGVGKEAIAYAVDMCRLHMRAHTLFYTQADVRHTHLLLDESVCPQELILLAVCDARGTAKPRARADEEERFLSTRLALYQDAVRAGMPSGAMLLAAGAKAGPAMGKALSQARRRVLCGVPLSTAVEEAVRTTHEAPAGDGGKARSSFRRDPFQRDGGIV